MTREEIKLKQDANEVTEKKMAAFKNVENTVVSVDMQADACSKSKFTNRMRQDVPKELMLIKNSHQRDFQRYFMMIKATE